MITVIGLGMERGDLSRRGEEAIVEGAKRGRKIVVRTALTRSYQTVLDLGVEHTSLDFAYEKSRNFSTLTKNLVNGVLACGEDAIYLVDGAATEDNSVKALIRRLGAKKVEIIDGVSKIGALVRWANLKGCSYSAFSAYELAEKIKTGVSFPILVYDIDGKDAAIDCMLLLSKYVGEETRVKFLQNGKAKSIRLYELDGQKSYDYATGVAIEELPLEKKERFSMDDLREILVRLRKPDGCPWDRVQTSESIKMAAVEEAYELVDAVDQKDDEKIVEETGDILLQAAFHALLGEERGSFDLSDALTGICRKLITRHTHVFGADKAKDEGSALSVWEKNKMTEKGQATYADAVNDVPKCFPAALRAQKVGKRAAKAGMDFTSVEQAAARLQEELAEFFEAYQSGNADQTERELGDLLFSAVNIGRKAGCDCEKALKESVERFAKRFTLAERLALQEHRVVTELSEEEWDSYYRQAKAQEN